MAGKRAKIQLLFTLAVAVGAGSSVQAVCDGPQLISSVFPPDVYSYVMTPGFTPGPGASSVSTNIRGYFWAIGVGDPVEGVGHDSGPFIGRRDGVKPWIRAPLGYPAYIHTSWAGMGTIDGCIDRIETTVRCTAVLLADQDEQGRSYFALLTAKAKHGDYLFAQPDNAPIVLAAVPRPTVSDKRPAGGEDLEVEISVDEPAAGLYLDPDCRLDAAVGYRLYAQANVRGVPPPPDRANRLFSPDATWQSARADGATPVLTFGRTTKQSVACPRGKDLRLAASLVFDSGFELPFVSESSPVVRCAD
jgi:hypothetical protein